MIVNPNFTFNIINRIIVNIASPILSNKYVFTIMCVSVNIILYAISAVIRKFSMYAFRSSDRDSKIVKPINYIPKLSLFPSEIKKARVLPRAFYYLYCFVVFTIHLGNFFITVILCFKRLPQLLSSALANEIALFKSAIYGTTSGSAGL